MKITVERSGCSLGDQIVKADTFWTRLKGLIGKSTLQLGEGLWITNCKQVHMIGMKFPISVVFVDKNLIVVGIVNTLKVGSVSSYIRKANSVIELPNNVLERNDIQLGDTLVINRVV